MGVYRGSRYINTKLYDHKGALTMDIRSRYVFDLTNAIYYTVVQGDTLDGIAYRQYGNTQLWWAILDANPQYQSELEVKAGDVLCIPPYEQVVRVSE
jgi:phage tail protein X